MLQKWIVFSWQPCLIFRRFYRNMEEEIFVLPHGVYVHILYIFFTLFITVITDPFQEFHDIILSFLTLLTYSR